MKITFEFPGGKTSPATYQVWHSDVLPRQGEQVSFHDWDTGDIEGHQWVVASIKYRFRTGYPTPEIIVVLRKWRAADGA